MRGSPVPIMAGFLPPEGDSASGWRPALEAGLRILGLKGESEPWVSAAVGNEVMHVRIRKSNVKRDKRGFRYRMKTRAGRKIIRDRRRIGRKMPGHKKTR